MLWSRVRDNKDSPPPVACRWGNDHEDDAEKFLKVETGPGLRVWHYGLVVDPEDNFLAYSPDGVCRLGDDGPFELVEYKCPYRFAVGFSSRARRPPRAPSDIYDLYQPPYGATNWEQPRGVPPQYWCQMMMGCWVLRGMNDGKPLPWVRFVVWTPTRAQVIRLPYDKAWHQHFVPKLRTWWHTVYRPAALLQRQGRLLPGETQEALFVVLDGPARQQTDEEPGAEHEPDLPAQPEGASSVLGESVKGF